MGAFQPFWQPLLLDAAPQCVSRPKHAIQWLSLTVSPSRATDAASTWPPFSRIASATRVFASGWVRNTTQPPPPAPQTLAAWAPALLAALTNFSISGVL